ncbi:MAG: hypothetical protein U0Z44_03215 [Kouleothrix sp.]
MDGALFDRTRAVGMQRQDRRQNDMSRARDGRVAPAAIGVLLQRQPFEFSGQTMPGGGASLSTWAVS